ncbi:MAG: CopG family antitoxin [Pseudomonadota bacterium]
MSKKQVIKKKKMPRLRTDEEAEAFLMQDLRPYLHSGNFVKVKFEFLPKDEKINLRLPAPLLLAIKERASKAEIPYQRYIRQIIENDLASHPR